MYILFGVSLFVYQTLDNIDGKQVHHALKRFDSERVPHSLCGSE